MTTDRDIPAWFLRKHGAATVGATPVQPAVLPEEGGEDEPSETVDRTVECAEHEWETKTVSEQPARSGEFPERFIDGSQAGRPVLCLRSPNGWPIPMVLSEVGAVAMRSVGRRFEREFVIVERVLSFVADPFPWEEVEAFASAILNKPELKLRLLPANMPDLKKHSPFDYEVMRHQATNRAQQEMTTLERYALTLNPSVATLVDGQIGRVSGNPKPSDPLLIGVTKSHSKNYLHDRGWRTLLSLEADGLEKKAQRTPVFRISGTGKACLDRTPVASWYVKLAGGPRLAPNWGYVRVEIPWGQFARRVKMDDKKDFGFVDRLSRWLIDARCRAASYARMPVSLDPIVRAEDALKPLFTPTAVLVNRLYRTAGLFRGNEG
ncbi:hypothetical protein J8F10_21560 [Gemmata sp. G18]|uniref:NurA domain-containing protein n=1 Tax=Gemmata palustris TaxID=2822762 RepID=A0ABS5BVV8_9BACT|nr:hypothetical protein [Gemmata palustris]MBP3957849.1 hypothetical protein [Gemmata palustris]